MPSTPRFLALPLPARRIQEEFIQTLGREQVAFDANIIKALGPALVTFDKVPHYEGKIDKMAKQILRINARVAKLRSRASTIQTNAMKAAATKKQ